MTGYRLCTCLISALVLWAAASRAQDNAPLDDYWVTNGSVTSLARIHGKLLVGGNFEYLGPSTGTCARLDKTTRAPDLLFPEFNAQIAVAWAPGAAGV